MQRFVEIPPVKTDQCHDRRAIRIQEGADEKCYSGRKSDGSTGVRGKIESTAAENLILLAHKSGHLWRFFIPQIKKNLRGVLTGSRCLRGWISLSTKVPN